MILYSGIHWSSWGCQLKFNLCDPVTYKSSSAFSLSHMQPMITGHLKKKKKTQHKILHTSYDMHQSTLHLHQGI